MSKVSLYFSDYLRNNISQRLKYWKARAAGNSPEYQDWRKTAKGSIGFMVKPEGLSGGFNGEGRGRVPVWVSFDAELHETPAHEILRLDHTGWYTDIHCENLAVGIVSKLPHGRYIAGYLLNMNDERVWFPDVYEGEDAREEAARAADSHAEKIADDEREYSQHWQDARDIETHIEEMETRAKECYALRHHRALGESAREELAELLDAIREKRQTLADDYADYT